MIVNEVGRALTHSDREWCPRRAEEVSLLLSSQRSASPPRPPQRTHRRAVERRGELGRERREDGALRRAAAPGVEQRLSSSGKNIAS